jgi:Zn-finger nucleic acid-binding protein
VVFYHSFSTVKSADPYRKITVLPICGGLWLDFGEGLAQKILVENY